MVVRLEKESILRSHNQASRSYVRAAPLSLERFAWPYRCSRHIERVAFDWRDISPRFPHIPWQSQTQTFIGSRKAVVVVKAPTSKARGIPKANLPFYCFIDRVRVLKKDFGKYLKGHCGRRWKTRIFRSFRFQLLIVIDQVISNVMRVPRLKRWVWPSLLERKVGGTFVSVLLFLLCLLLYINSQGRWVS